MTIGFDIDGVLADFNKSFAPLITERTGIVLPPVDDNYPDTWTYDQAAGVTPEQSAGLWRELAQDPSFWLNLPPTKYCASSLDRLQDLRSDGHQVYFITTRPGEFAGRVAGEWLAKHGFINAIVYVAKTSQEKAEFAHELGLQFFIDDKPENCAAVSDITPWTYILDQPWNRYWDNGAEVVLRVFHPIEAIDHFVRSLTHG